MSSQYSVLGNRPIDKWKVVELKEELRRRKLATKGSKEELVKRLDEVVRSERETGNDFGNGISTNSDSIIEQKDAKINFMENQTVDDGTETVLNVVDKVNENLYLVNDVSMADVGGAITGTGLIKEADGKSSTEFQEINEVSNQGVKEQGGDFEQAMKPQDEDSEQEMRALYRESDQGMEAQDVKSDQGMNAQDVKSDQGMKAQDVKSDQGLKAQDQGMECMQAGVNEESGKVIINSDAESRRGAEVCNKESDAETKAYDGSLRESAEADVMVVESAIPAATSETAGTNSQGVLSQLESSEPESRCNKTQEEDEELKPPVEDYKSYISNPNNQVSEVCHVLEFQVKSESISTISVSINEKNELKDNLNVDNFHLEREVKLDMVEPSSCDVPTIGGEIHSVGDLEASDMLGSREEADNTVSTKESPNKKKDNADARSEKLNLDRSSGDDSMEEDVLDSKQIDSNHNSEATVDRTGTIQSHEVKEGISSDATVTGSSPDKGDNIVGKKNVTSSAEKRKLRDYETGPTNEPTKWQRRWNLPTVKEPEPKSTNLTPSSIPRDVPQSVKNLANVEVPETQSTNLTPSSTPRDLTQSLKKRTFTRSDSINSGDTPEERVVPPSPKIPTTSLRIDRFLRPFTLKAVQELLAKTGNVSSFWMDHIKTHCYVTYSSVEEAVATRNALYNLQWPPNGGRSLTAEFVNPQEVQARVEAPPVSPAPISPSPGLNAAPSAPPVHLSPHHHVPRQQLPPPPPLSDPPLVRDRQQPPPKQLDLQPIVTLDDLFRKTKATPRIYYSPLSQEQVTKKLATAQGRNTKR